MGSLHTFQTGTGVEREQILGFPSETTSAVVYTPVTQPHRRLRHMAIDAALWSLARVIVWSVAWDEWRGKRAQPTFPNALDAIYPHLLEADHEHD